MKLIFYGLAPSNRNRKPQCPNSVDYDNFWIILYRFTFLDYWFNVTLVCYCFNYSLL